MVEAHPSAVPTPPRRRRTQPEWEQYKEVIHKLYLNEDRSAMDTIDILRQRYAFSVSERQFKHKIQQWGLKKNVTTSTKAAIVAKMQKRKLEEGKETKFLYRGRELNHETLNRYSKKLAKPPNHDSEPEELSISTPSDISYSTPPPWPPDSPVLPRTPKKFGSIPIPENDTSRATPASVHISDQVSNPSLLEKLPTSEVATQNKTCHPVLEEDARLRVVWETMMTDLGKRATYRNVACLLISWNAKSESLSTAEEVSQLKGVFQEKYHFDVRDERLSEEYQKGAELRITSLVANFILEEDHEDRLLIVYYNGHGLPGFAPRQLIPTGSRWPNPAHDDKIQLNQNLWRLAESLLSDTCADVLLILDGCYAGYPDRRQVHRVSRPSRTIELLATITNGPRAPFYGAQSFTPNLIWALEALATENTGYTTSELLQKINDAPLYWPGWQLVLIGDDTPSPKRILIAPLGVESEQDEAFSLKRSDIESNNLAASLEIRLMLTRVPSSDDIENICQAMKFFIGLGQTPVRRVEWGKLLSVG